jgi:hypothetical protein
VEAARTYRLRDQLSVGKDRKDRTSGRKQGGIGDIEIGAEGTGIELRIDRSIINTDQKPQQAASAANLIFKYALVCRFLHTQRKSHHEVLRCRLALLS